MAKRTVKTITGAPQVKTTLQQFVDSGTYRDDIVLREGVAAFIQGATPMLMDWAAEQKHHLLPTGNGARVSAHDHDHGDHVAASEEEVQEAVTLGVNPMLCPGVSYECAVDVVRIYKVSKTVSHRARRRMHRVIDRYIRGMNRIARKEGKGRVALRVRLNLTPTGPELAFGLASEYPGQEI